jgi:hypothetical protein
MFACGTAACCSSLVLEANKNSTFRRTGVEEGAFSTEARRSKVPFRDRVFLVEVADDFESDSLLGRAKRSQGCEAVSLKTATEIV